MQKILWFIVGVVLLSACAPANNTSRTSRFYDVGENGMALRAADGLSDQQHSETLSFQGSYEDVYYQAMRVARSMTMQQNPSLANWFSDNWYLASENMDIGDIIVTQNVSVCQANRPDTCLPFQNAVKVSVRANGDGGSKVYIQASDWNAASTEAQFVSYYIDELKQSIN